jgi:hypothetical protein
MELISNDEKAKELLAEAGRANAIAEGRKN